jgi:2-polyprenyl-6-hydroxyphenyl methylase/3-demethylubiquinone-9 3-methyltransferase
LLKDESGAPDGCKICGSDRVASLYHVEREDESFDILTCQSCGMHFIDYLDPQSSPDEIGRAADRAAAVDSNIESHVAGHLEANAQRQRQNVETLERHVKGGAILDVGSGGGGFLHAVKDRFERAVGLELDPKYIAYSRASGLEIVTRPLEDDYWDAMIGQFDAITLWDVIEHVNDPLLISSRIKRLLKPGGVLLMDTPNRDGLFYKSGEMVAKLTRGRNLSTMGLQYSSSPFCHKQIFGKRHMRDMLSRSGFTDIRIMERTELSYPVEWYTSRLVPLAPLRLLINPLASAMVRLLPIHNKQIVVAR